MNFVRISKVQTPLFVMNRLFQSLVALLLLSCNNQLLVPLSFNPNIDEEPISVIEADSLLFLVEHIEQKNDFLVFDVEIQNNSSHDIQVVTNQFYDLSGYTKDQVVGENIISEASLMSAVDEHRFNMLLPKEQVLAYYDKKIGDNTAALGLLFVLGAGLLINDAVKDARDFSSYEWTDADESRAILRDAGVDLGLFTMDVAGTSMMAAGESLDQDRYYVDDEILKSQLLRSGSTTRGKIHFRTAVESKYHLLVLPVNGINYMFPFRKRKESDKQKLYNYDLKNGRTK